MASCTKTTEFAPFHFGSLGGKNEPMSPAPTAPNSASVMACSSTSPSECPANPCVCGIATPPMRSAIPSLNSCESNPCPILIFDQQWSAAETMATCVLNQPMRAIRDAPRLGLRLLGIQIKLCQFQIRRRSDLDILCRTHHNIHVLTRALQQRRLVCPEEAFHFGLVEGFFQNAVPKTLRSLCLHQ